MRQLVKIFTFLVGLIFFQTIFADENQVNSIPDDYFLKKYPKLAETITKSVHITLDTPKEKLALWSSKVGGIPYLPTDEEAPRTSKGEKLTFIAQINFSEVPAIDDFPKKGLLQFWAIKNNLAEDYAEILPEEQRKIFIEQYNAMIDDDQEKIDDESLNMIFQAASEEDWVGIATHVPTTKQDQFRVIYYADINPNQSRSAEDFNNDILLTFDDEIMEAAMQFDLRQEHMYPVDYRFEKNYGKADDDFGIYLEMGLPAAGHKLGGYPDFTQTDPRGEYAGAFRSYDTLLLQLDGDEEFGLFYSYGDTCVGNFFINKDKLKKLDFSDILFNWDCT